MRSLYICSQILFVMANRNSWQYRLEKLKNSLQAFDKQTNSPKYILVVNNASTDGTEEFLREWLKTKTPYRKYSKANANVAPQFTDLPHLIGLYIRKVLHQPEDKIQ